MGITSQPRRQPNTLSCPCCLRITVGVYRNCPYCGQELQSIPSQSSAARFAGQSGNQSKTERPGGLAVRSLAFLSDVFLISLSFALFCLVLYAAVEISHNYRLGEGITTGGFSPFYLLLAFLVYHALYFVFFHGYGGTTPGMGIFRLKLIRIKKKQRLSYLRSGLRFLLSISLGPLVLGFWWGLFSGNNQHFHDLVTGTRVVRAC